MIYVTTAKNKLLNAGIKIDIDKWLEDGWLIKKGVRFLTPETVLKVVTETTGITDENLKDNYSVEYYRIRQLLWYFLHHYSALTPQQAAEFTGHDIKSVTIGIKSIEIKINHDLGIISYYDLIAKKLNNEIS